MDIKLSILHSLISSFHIIIVYFMNWTCPSLFQFDRWLRTVCLLFCVFPCMSLCTVSYVCACINQDLAANCVYVHFISD